MELDTKLKMAHLLLQIRQGLLWVTLGGAQPADQVCQAIKPTQSDKPCPFPSPGWRHGPSFPGWSTHYLILVTANWKFLIEVRRSISPSTLSGELLNSNWSSNFPVWPLFGHCFSLQFTYPSF